MANRLIEIYIPEIFSAKVSDILEAHDQKNIWRETVKDEILHIQILTSTDQSQAILDLMGKHFSGVEGFKIIILPVSASLPQADDEEKEKNETQKTKLKKGIKKNTITREELYEDIKSRMQLNWVFVILVLLSSIVAAVGLLKDNVAVVIGAMVIAPLLGPNVGLALSTTLADYDLGKKALLSNIVAIAIGFAFSVILGLLVDVDPSINEILSRTEVGLGDIALALASGSAGALALTTGISTALVGVMVAVALLPPLVVLGLLIGSGNFDYAWGAFLLLLTNLISVNLAGVVTFWARGIRPRSWWEANRAKKASRTAIIFWLILIILLCVVIVISRTDIL